MIGVLALCLCVCVGQAQILKLITAPAPPFVINNTDGSLTGFAIDLWNATFRAAQFNSTIVTGYEWVLLDTGVASIIPYLINNEGSADVGISDISITSARQKLVDFSPSMYSSGLSIMVPYSPPKMEKKSTALVRNMFSNLFWQELGILLLGVFFAAQAYYFLERKKKGVEATIRPNYTRGGFEDSIWWSGQILLSGGADVMPSTIGGRLLNLVAFLFALVLMSIIGGTITASLTVASLTVPTGIQGVRGLNGHQVGVVNQSTADFFLQALTGTYIVRFPTSAAMLQAFNQPSPPMDAVVFDYPVLEYFATNTGAGKFKLVGGVFSPQDYGMAFPRNSSYILEIDVALLKLKEDGTYDAIHANWFTGSSSSQDTASVSAPQADTVLLGVTYGVAGFLFLLTAAVFIWNVRRRKQRATLSSSSSLEMIGSPRLTPKESASRLVGDIQKIKNALTVIEEGMTQRYELA